MSESTDSSVTVIGAGIIGICCACYLQRSGFQVTLIDREEPAMQTSFGNAGGISPGSVAPIGMPGMWQQIPRWLIDDKSPLFIKARHFPKVLPWLMRFISQSRRSRVLEISKALTALNGPTFAAYQPLLEEAGITGLFHKTGQLFVYHTRQNMEKDTLTRDLRSASGASVEYLDSKSIQDLEPALAPVFEAGYLMPDNGHCKDPLGLAQALVQMFVDKGGRLLKTEVRDFVFETGEITGLLTASGQLPAAKVVIAAGIWSRELCLKLGWRVPLESHRGYHATLEEPGVSVERMCFLVDYKFAVTPMAIGLRIAGTVELAGLEEPPNYNRARKLVDVSQKLFPGLCTEKYTQWMGHRPCLPDSLPVIGASPHHPGVYFAFGHGHQGLVGASQTAKVINELIRGTEPSMVLQPFRIDRF